MKHSEVEQSLISNVWFRAEPQETELQVDEEGTLVIKKLLMEQKLRDKIISLNSIWDTNRHHKNTRQRAVCNLRLLQVWLQYAETATGKGHGLFQTHYYALYQSVDIAFLFSLSLSGQGGVGRIKMLKEDY